MRINHNLPSMITQGSLFKVNRSMSKSLEKLSTGLRINRASDDAAGLGVSENLRKQVRGMGQALKNTQDAIAMLNIADGALNEQAAILQRMRELVIQAKNDTYSETERAYMGQEFSQLMEELDRIAAVTNYNGMQIFASPEKTEGTLVYGDNLERFNPPREIADGRTIWDDPNDYIFGSDENYTSAHHFNLMIGGNYTTDDANAYNSGVDEFSWDKDAPNMLTIQFGQMDSNTLLLARPSFGMDASDYLETNGNPFGWDPATDAEDNTIDTFFWGGNGSVQRKLDVILHMIDNDYGTDPWEAWMDQGGGGATTGLDRVNTMRAHVGATINRLEHTVDNLTNQIHNTQAAESVIRDADFASEATRLTRTQILSRSATAMLAQANVTPQSVLQLLG